MIFVAFRVKIDNQRGLARIVGVAGPATVVWVSGDEDEADLRWGLLSQIARTLPGSRAAVRPG